MPAPRLYRPRAQARPGAGGNIAAQPVAAAAPDGYTLLSISSAHTSAPAIHPKPQFDVGKDFADITTTASGPRLLIVTRGFSWISGARAWPE